MKKITSLLLAVLMLVAIIPTSVLASDNLTVTVGEKTIYADEGTVSIDITMANNPGIAVIGFEIDYPSDAFKLESVTNGSIFAESEVDGNVDRTPFMFNAYNGKANKNGNGTLVTLNFSVKENAAAKKHDFKIQKVEVLNIDEEPVDYDANNGSVTIKNRDFTDITFADAEYTYDGTAKALAVSGAPADAAVTYTCRNFDKDGKAINAGTYNITATVEKDGYNDWTNTKTLKINKKVLEIKGLTAKNKTYDGTDKATLSGGTLLGAVEGDDVSVKMPTEGEFADKNVGNDKAVTIINTITLSGAKKGNYTLTQPTDLKANITKAPLSVKADNKDMFKGNSLPTLTYTVTEGTKYEEDAITGALATNADGTKTGSFDITQGTLEASKNYQLSFTNGTLTVTDKKTQNVDTTIPTSKTYGDAPFTFTITDNETNVTGEITVTSSKPDVATVENNSGTVTVTIKKAGTTEIRVFRAGNDTYADFDEKSTLAVGKKTLKIKAKSDSVKQSDTLALPTLDSTWWSLDESTPLAYTDTIENTISGALAYAENATRKTLGTYAIKQGSLSVSDNYRLEFTEGALIVEEKDNQDVIVSDIAASKTYGDTPFTFTITDNETNVTGDITVTSSKPDVATVENNSGTVTVTIKKAGTTEIRMFRTGNETYTDFEKKTTLTVSKKTLKIKAKSDIVKQSDTLALPTLDSTWWSLDESTPLAYTDTIENTISGALAYAENATRKTLGTYAIKQGSLSVSDNYRLEFTEGTITVEPKSLQTVTITAFETKTYGDEFNIEVTSTAGLDVPFTYESDNTAVATVDENGKITIIGVGEANITATQAGNEVYASAQDKKKLTVKQKEITVTSVNLENKTAALDGVLESDKETVTLDFDKINVTLGDTVDETSTNAVLTNFVLKGDKASNYNITTESMPVVLNNNMIVDVTISAENGTVTGAGKYLKGAEVTVNATPNSGYKFDGWYNGDTSVSTSASYTFKAESDISLVAKFSRKSTGGGGGGGSSTSTYTIKFETNGGSTIDSVKVDKNKTITEPTVPTKDGFEFAGWYTDKALTTKYDFDTNVTKGVTLYAAWTEKKVEVKDDNTEPTEPTTPENKITFTDVKENDWFAENVKYVFENGLMNGTTETEFAPNDNLTRAMLVAILYRAAGEPEVNKSVPFADVTADSYYANAVIWAQQNGIVSGVNENEFAPDENITREQIATIIYRYANYKGYDTSAKADISAYADADEISEYATEAMQYAVASGLIKGKTETTLNPQDNATRAEIAAILQRFIEGNK